MILDLQYRHGYHNGYFRFFHRYHKDKVILQLVEITSLLMATCLCHRHGRMECWNTGLRLGENIEGKSENKLFKLSKTPSNPSLHYSNGAKPLSSPFLGHKLRKMNVSPQYHFLLSLYRKKCYPYLDHFFRILTITYS